MYVSVSLLFSSSVHGEFDWWCGVVWDSEAVIDSILGALSLSRCFGSIETENRDRFLILFCSVMFWVSWGRAPLGCVIWCLRGRGCYKLFVVSCCLNSRMNLALFFVRMHDARLRSRG